MPDRFGSALAEGWRALLRAPAAHRALAAALGVLLLAMLPFGRTRPGDAGGLLAPLTADSGLIARQVPGIDFYSVYDAGTRLLRGLDPYGVNAATGGPGLRAPWVATYRYLPITAFWLAAPLNILPPRPAYVAWVLVCVAMVAGNFLLCAGRRPESIPFWALLWFAWFPTIAELHMGQFTLFMATLMLWSLDGLLDGRGRGVGWALAVLLKVYPVAMAPSLFLWKRRGVVILTVALAVGSTVAWKAAMPAEAMEEGLGRRGVYGRLVGGTRQPYAGAQGVQELAVAAGCVLGGRSFRDAVPAPPPPLQDPVFLTNAVVLGSFALLCGWALWRTRRAPSAEAIGLFWLAWFYAYVDCWEHHYALAQALLALLVLRRVVEMPLALLCWACAGGPSLWWLWQRTGLGGNPLSEAIGLLYFVQRPVAVLMLSLHLARRLARPETP